MQGRGRGREKGIARACVVRVPFGEGGEEVKDRGIVLVLLEKRLLLVDQIPARVILIGRDIKTWQGTVHTFVSMRPSQEQSHITPGSSAFYSLYLIPPHHAPHQTTTTRKHPPLHSMPPKPMRSTSSSRYFEVLSCIGDGRPGVNCSLWVRRSVEPEGRDTGEREDRQTERVSDWCKHESNSRW